MGKLSDNDIKESSVYALFEADRWYQVGKIIDNDSSLYKQCSVIKLLASELYLKAILLHQEKNITTRYKPPKGTSGHSLQYLFNTLDNITKQEIKDETEKELKKYVKKGKDYFPIKIEDSISGDLLVEYNIFEDALNKIDCDFMNLRYDYDKLTNRKNNKNYNKNMNINLLGFINAFSKILKELAYKAMYKGKD